MNYFSISEGKGSIPELDGFRGIAILFVLLRHAVRPIYEEHGTLFLFGTWDLATPFLNGWMGVDLFFVLSGFLITYHLINHWPDKFSGSFLLSYCKKRILRIFPAYYACVLIVAFGWIPFYQPNIINIGDEIFKHLVFMQDYSGTNLVSAFWSLGVEVKFYLLCPFVLLCLKMFSRQRLLDFLLLLAIAPLVLRISTMYAYQDIIQNYPMFFWIVRAPAHLAFDGLWLGSICACIYHWNLYNTGHKHTNALLLLGLIVLMYCLFSYSWFDEELFWASSIVLALVPLSFSLVIMITLRSETFFTGILKSGWLRFFARISYSVYLTHLLILPLCLDILSKLVSSMNASPILQFLILLPIFLLMSILSGLVLHLLIEKPFLLIKERVVIR